MPIIKSAIKRMKQTAKRRERNVATKRDIKSAVKTFIEKPTAAGLSKAHSEIDTAVKKNLIPKNTAARRKAHLARMAKDAGIKSTAAVKKAAPKAKATATKAAAPKKPAVKAKAAPAKKPTAAKATATKKTAAKKTTK